MTTPTATGPPFRREPVSADRSLGDLAIGEQRLYGEIKVALAALGLHPLPSCGQAELVGSAVAVLQGGLFLSPVPPDLDRARERSRAGAIQVQPRCGPGDRPGVQPIATAG